MGKATQEPQRAKRNLLDDSDSDSDDGGAAVAAPGFKVNEEFARRFEHNKKREERQRLEEKFKKTGKKPSGDDDGDDSSSSDETEDEDGFLATEDLDAQISATLQAIRNKDPKVYDKEVSFYKPDDPAEAGDADKKEKPVYLRDYHREKLLRGDTGADEEDEDVPMTYNQEQDALKKSIVAEMHAAAADSDGSDDEDDGFLKRKEPAKIDSNGLHPSRKAAVQITDTDIANADKNPETFLSNFMSARAWVPPDGSNWKAFESDEGEDDDQADEFEQAYNLRFEDPEKSNEFLRSYARDVAAAKSVRREEKSGRKRQRELERERKEAEKQERREEKARLRRLKLEEAQEKLRKIKHAAGSAGKELTDEDWIKFLDDAWENDKWEEEMQKRFGEEYYAQNDEVPVSDEEEEEDGEKKKKKHPKKPKWDDDIDIKDLIPDFEDDQEKPNISLSDVEDDAAKDKEEDEDEDEDGRPSKKRKTTDHKKARKEAQKQARQERAKLEALVDSKLELTNHDLLSKPAHAPFRYRETSPQSFGMTARDILLAPSDAALNEYAGLKKLATFRDEEKKRKDRKRFGKKARLRQWRREIFGKQFERSGPTYGFERLASAEDGEAAAGTIIEPKAAAADKDSNVVGDVGERKKKRKRSKGKKGAVSTTTTEAEA